MKRNDSLLKAASYFWSNDFNAFIFGHSPMTITLADVFMLTGLRITDPLQPFDLLSKPSCKLGNLKNGGWSGYITNQKKSGTVDEKGHATFLNMWLEKHVFCGSSYAPTNNNLYLVEHLASGADVPLGKYLLGSFYHLSIKYPRICWRTSRLAQSMGPGGYCNYGFIYICIRW